MPRVQFETIVSCSLHEEGRSNGYVTVETVPSTRRSRKFVASAVTNTKVTFSSCKCFDNGLFDSVDSQTFQLLCHVDDITIFNAMVVIIHSVVKLTSLLLGEEIERSEETVTIKVKRFFAQAIRN